MENKENYGNIICIIRQACVKRGEALHVTGIGYVFQEVGVLQ